MSPEKKKETVFALFEACGYSLDVMRLERNGLGTTYSAYVFETDPRAAGEEKFDADSYEARARGERFDKFGTGCESLYGHSGFHVGIVDSASDDGPGFEPIRSEGECFDVILKRLFAGDMKDAYPKLPSVGSEQELELWLAARGAL